MTCQGIKNCDPYDVKKYASLIEYWEIFEYWEISRKHFFFYFLRLMLLLCLKGKNKNKNSKEHQAPTALCF